MNSIAVLLRSQNSLKSLGTFVSPNILIRCVLHSRNIHLQCGIRSGVRNISKPASWRENETKYAICNSTKNNVSIILSHPWHLTASAAFCTTSTLRKKELKLHKRAGQTSAAPSASKEFSELSKKQISAVFGPTVPADVGNEILARLQHQRTTGTLDSGFNAPGVDEQLLLNALAWLRATYPMDEDAAIIARLDEEEREEERALLAKAEKIGLYKPQQSAEKDGIYGKSQLEAIRHENEMKYEEELQAKQTQKSQADEIRNLSGDSEIIQDSQRRAVVARRTQSAEWVKKYKERAVLSQDTKPPEMSKIRRLLPAGIVTLVVVGACYFLAQNYVPPPRVARLFPDIPPAAATYVGLFVMNAVVLVMWRIPPFWRFMNQYFLIIPGAPRATSILGNVISHQSIMHFSGNMLVLWFIGTQREL